MNEILIDQKKEHDRIIQEYAYIIVEMDDVSDDEKDQYLDDAADARAEMIDTVKAYWENQFQMEMILNQLDVLEKKYLKKREECMNTFEISKELFENTSLSTRNFLYNKSAFFFPL